MANNFDSFGRFSALPPDIAKFGTTLEEIKSSSGTPDRNPVASPMPEAKIPHARLALTRQGSDNARVEHLNQPSINPHDGPTPLFILSRTALRKLRSPIFAALSEALQDEAALPEEMAGRMRDSLQRISQLQGLLDSLQEMSETIYIQAVSANRE